MKKFLIDETNAGERLDRFLAKELDFSRSRIQKEIISGGILVNDETTKSNYRLENADEIIVAEIKTETFEIVPQKIDLDICFEDQSLLVINKPQGLVVYPGAGKEKISLVSGLLAYTNDLSDINGEKRRGIVHRIDKDTSGLLIIAKNNDVHLKLAESLKKHEVIREYWCLVHGVIATDKGYIDAPIGRDPKDRMKMTVTSKASKEAQTSFEVIQRYNNFTLIKCLLQTGRTHQIRVHLKYIKHPIVGDLKYTRKNRFQAEKQLLHAKRLKFKHPVTGEMLEFKTELPVEFQAILEELSYE